MRKRLTFLWVVFMAWLPVFALQKPVFMLYHHALATDIGWTDYLQVIRHGLLLDCTISGYLTILPFFCIVCSVWFPNLPYRNFLKGYFMLSAILIAAIFSIDVALYGFWGFRLDATLFFYLKSPKEAMASVPVGLFFVQLGLFALYTAGIFMFLSRFVLSLFPSTKVKRRWKSSIVCLFIGGILFIPIRGGITTSTANVGMVYFSNNQFLNHAAINPCFSLSASLSKQQDFASQFNFFSEHERQEIVDELLPSTEKGADENPHLKMLKNSRPHILLILMESFSASVVGAVGGDSTITPHLNRLSKEGILFRNMYANSFRTDRGIVSVLNGYLAQPTTSIMKYPAKSQTLPSLAKSLEPEGYTADMVYGGDINFTNMQSYFFGSGYSRITSDRNFPISSRLNKWGANDDISFHYLYEAIRKRPAEPRWLTTFLTLSSHEPFEVPYHRLPDKYPNSVAFTDSCIGEFVDKLKQLPVWENLLIVLISDHGFPYPEDVTAYEPRRFHIPMIWLGGVIKNPSIIDRYANQTDLAATLLSQMDLPHNDFQFSRDLFSKNNTEYAFYTYPNGFGFIDSTGISVFDNEGGRILIETPRPGSDSRIRKGKALLQTLYDDLGSR